jgi:hypothetical protein
MNYVARFYHAAKGKMTTYLALGIAGFSQLADHAEDLRSQWPGLRAYLPAGDWVDHVSHAILSILGALIVWSRVRRLLKPTPESSSPAASEGGKA